MKNLNKFLLEELNPRKNASKEIRVEIQRNILLANLVALVDDKPSYFDDGRE